ncbi:MAG: hypothetical protein QME94_06390 [Anaerolineae bacterium]|nr:hypothetical protein [Anaerolineae bacterium]
MAGTNGAGPLPAAGPGPGEAGRAVSRRHLLLGAGGAAAALVASNAVTLAVTHRVSTAAAEARAEEQRHELEAEIRLLKRQLALYHELDRVGLDDLIRNLLEVYDRLWPPVRDAVGLLLRALRAVEEGLTHFEAGLSTLRGAARTFSGLLAGIESRIQGLERSIADALACTPPVGQAVAYFLAWLIDRLPFGLGGAIVQAAERLGELGASLPTLISEARSKLLGPLDDEWLSQREGEGLQGRLFTPLRAGLLEPLRVHLEEVDRMAGQWEEQSAQPLRAALDERARIRQELERVQSA